MYVEETRKNVPEAIVRKQSRRIRRRVLFRYDLWDGICCRDIANRVILFWIRRRSGLRSRGGGFREQSAHTRGQKEYKAFGRKQKSMVNRSSFPVPQREIIRIWEERAAVRSRNKEIISIPSLSDDPKEDWGGVNWPVSKIPRQRSGA